VRWTGRQGPGSEEGDGGDMVVWADRFLGREREVDFRGGSCRESRKRGEK